MKNNDLTSALAQLSNVQRSIESAMQMRDRVRAQSGDLTKVDEAQLKLRRRAASLAYRASYLLTQEGRHTEAKEFAQEYAGQEYLADRIEGLLAAGRPAA